MKTSTKRMVASLLLCLFSACILAGCGGTTEKKLVIGYQQGVGSTAFIVMEELGLLQEYLPAGYTVEYVVMNGGGTAVREALSNSSVDVGLMGTPPIVIAADKELPIKIICGISASPISIYTNKDSIHSLSDIKDEKIAILAYGSTQHITLSMIADKLFGDPFHFANNLVILPESEAYVAMDSGVEINNYFGMNPTKTRVGHLDGVREVDSSTNYGIKISSLIACINTKYAEQNPEISDAIVSALESVFAWIEENPEETVRIVADALGIDSSILEEVYEEEKFSTEIFGYDDCADYMFKLGMIENEPVKLEDMMIN